MDKLLTIIIPSYNMEKFLPQCLDSLVKCKNAELLDVLVMNDGSKDGTSKIGHRYESEYHGVVRVIDKKNGNYGSCVNRGLKEAVGKYVKILDADDSYDTKNLDAMLSRMRNVDVDLFLTDTLQVNPKGKVLYKNTFQFPVEQVLNFRKFPNMGELLMHCIAYRLDVLKKINYVQTEGISYTDTEWAFYPMMEVKTFYYLPKEVYRYLLGREGQTKDPAVYKKCVSQESIISRRMISYWTEKVGNTEPSYANQYLVARMRRIYKQEILCGECHEDFISFDKFMKVEAPLLYDYLDECCLYGRREKIHFIRDWRKKYKTPLKFYLCVWMHKLLGSEK